jgi:hypothetical protein
MTDHERTEDFKTSCKTCVFAQWEEGVQIDTCDMGRLEKYIDRGQTESHPDGYQVIQTICNACRGTKWMSQLPLNTNLVAAVEDEIKVSVAFIIVVTEQNTEKMFKLLHERLNECVNQKQIAPSEIILLVQNTKAKSSEIYEMANEICGNVACKLVRIVDELLPLDSCLDLAVQNISKSRYYCVVYLTHRISVNTIKLINQLINNDLRIISVIKPAYGFSGLVVQTMLHKIFGGNKLLPIHEKIEEAAKVQGKTDFILRWDEVWNYQE